MSRALPLLIFSLISLIALVFLAFYAPITSSVKSIALEIRIIAKGILAENKFM